MEPKTKSEHDAAMTLDHATQPRTTEQPQEDEEEEAIALLLLLSDEL